VTSAEQNEEPSTLARRRLVMGLGAAPLLGLLPGCGGGGASAGTTGGAAGLAASPASAASAPTATLAAATATATASFVHPGLMHTEADFARMRTKVAAKAQPWLDGWNALTSSSRSQLGRAPTPLKTVVRGGDGENYHTMVEDLERAYQFALRWKVSGDEAYALQAVAYLNAWSSTMTTLTGNNDRVLAAGIYGYQWANAAEIMRSYAGWAAADVARFQALLVGVFYPISHQFLIDHNGSNITSYWANWDMCSLAAILAIGVFCDRRDLYDEALAYYKTGRGNGASAHSVYALHPGHLGQWQESARDHGHATLSLSLAAMLCEMAWNQGEDLYGYANNRFLAGAEYVAKTNLKDAAGQYYTVPFSRYVNRQGTFTLASTSGQPNNRPCWESIYNHYVNRKGMSAPYASAMAAALRPDRDEWVGDDPSFGTLTFSRDPIAAGAAPSGLTASLANGKVLLSWWGSAYATSYRVERAAATSGPFTAVASGIADPRTWLDAPGAGTWFYRVIAVSPAGETAPSAVIRAALANEMLAHLPLDAGSGTTAADTSSHGLAGTLAGGASWGAGRTGGSALALDGKSGHLALPAGAVAGLGDFTVAVWVWWNAAATNLRVFDFGSSDIGYMALTPRDGSGNLKFFITGTSYFGEQSVSAQGPLATGRWVHLAVTLSGTTGTVYVDGRVAGSNDAIVFAPFQLGNTTQNWLGRSQYAADGYFNGRMQDLRIHAGALSAADIAALAAA
jgi:hypothetical protein